jgi:hypothetical protein
VKVFKQGRFAAYSICVALTFGFAAESGAQTNIIDTTYGAGAGSFELGAFINNGMGFMALAPGNTTITGWTVGGPGNGVDWLASPGFRADSGLRSIDLQELSNSSISTVIPTVVGQAYLLTFGAAAISGLNSDGKVTAGSLVGQPFTAPFSPNYATQTFATISMSFTATAPATIIRFEATGPVLPACTALVACYGPVIDTVSVVAVPEPSSALLLAIGGFFVAASVRSTADRARSRDA